jgi:ribonuclease BN (tRNA processing enzyme)
LRKELGDQPFRGTALVSHLHWDHVQGLPFFVPLLAEGASLTLVGPAQIEGSLQNAVESFVQPPLFPVALETLPGQVEFVESTGSILRVGATTITSAAVAHAGETNGYRIQNGSGSLAYLPDHQQPVDGSLEVPESVVELCRGVDVLIHDAQYDAEEFEVKATWGHSTVDYAVEVARASGVRRLVLFHHDPLHDDLWVAEATAHARDLAGDDIEVFAAVEGLTIRSGSDLPVDDPLSSI